MWRVKGGKKKSLKCILKRDHGMAHSMWSAFYDKIMHLLFSFFFCCTHSVEEMGEKKRAPCIYGFEKNNLWSFKIYVSQSVGSGEEKM